MIRLASCVGIMSLCTTHTLLRYSGYLWYDSAVCWRRHAPRRRSSVGAVLGMSCAWVAGAIELGVDGLQQRKASAEVQARQFVAGAVLSRTDTAGVTVDPLSCTVAMQISPVATAMVARRPPPPRRCLRNLALLPRAVQPCALFAAVLAAVQQLLLIAGAQDRLECPAAAARPAMR